MMAKKELAVSEVEHDDAPAVLEAATEGKAMLTVAEQFERNMKIVKQHARGDSWPVIAQRHNLSIRRCQYIHTEYRKQHRTIRHIDPTGIVDTMLEGYQADLTDLNIALEQAVNTSERTGVVNARARVRERITVLLQAVGVLPHDLGTLHLELDAQVVFAKVIAVMERYDLPEEAFEELLTEMGGPPPGYDEAVEGTAEEIAA